MLRQLVPNASLTEARNGSDALQLVSQYSFEVAFLDVNMPGVSGLGVAALIAEKPNPPLIVFATAYDAHAVRAFELAALDYVVKPFSEQRLAQTMARVRRALAEREQLTQKRAATRTYLRTMASANSLQKLWCERENETIVLVDYADILWIEAQEKRVYVHTPSAQQLLTPYTLAELEERLHAHHIVRVHKGYLVYLDHVSEVVPWFSGTYILRVNDAAQSEVPMSRQYAKEFKQMLG